MERESQGANRGTIVTLRGPPLKSRRGPKGEATEGTRNDKEGQNYNKIN
jgi:hypothetical protein